jgi:hypothetical protein
MSGKRKSLPAGSVDDLPLECPKPEPKEGQNV